jgi:hypothetical protein
LAATGANAAAPATAAAASVTWNLVATVVMSPHTFDRNQLLEALQVP